MKEKSFFQKRMDAIGLTEEHNTLTVFNPEAEPPIPAVIKDFHIFKEDTQTGDILINYYDLDRQLITYYKLGDGKMGHTNGKLKFWFQRRLKLPYSDTKYIMPKGQGVYPFLPPNIITAFEQEEKIKTLFLTEGAITAMCAAIQGIYIIGFTSITHYRCKDTGKLHPDIERIIITCKVENVVILWDGDCLDISLSHLYRKEDIRERPFIFFNSAKNIRQLIYDIDYPEDHHKVLVHFANIKSDSINTKPKGLDDLIVDLKDSPKLASVIDDLHNTDKGKNFYFHFINITASTASLNKYFMLDDVDKFYYRHSQIIGGQEFVFNGHIYSYDESQNKVRRVAAAWAKTIKWVGDDFFKIVEEPRMDGSKNLVLKKRSKQTLSDLYEKNFFKQIPHYEGFCNIPDHFNYKEVHGSFYNQYFPIAHKPKKGNIDTSLMFIKHIFGTEKINYKGREISSYELGIDYLQILLCEPKQTLPVLILYSPENATGKSTLGNWEQAILQHNSIQITNIDLKSNFNDHWATKLLAICEETLLDRKTEAEKIKNYSTAHRITVNPKGFKQYEIDYFCKFQFYSNNKRMIYLSKNDERFWIRRVPVAKKKDPFLLQKLVEEIPAFLHFIKNRTLSTDRDSRMHFDPTLLVTETLRETIKVNQPSDSITIHEKIKEMFLDFGQKQILMPLKHINKEFFNGKANNGWLKEILSDYLEADRLRNKDTGRVKQVRGYYYKFIDDYSLESGQHLKKVKVSYHDRPYVFNRADYVTEEEEFEVDETFKIEKV